MLRCTDRHEVSSHYHRLGRSIGDSGDPQQRTWFYDREFEHKVMEAMVRELEAEPAHRVVDLGAGTCAFAVRLHSRLGLNSPVTCVDPSAAMMDNRPSTSTITPVLSGALEFSARPEESYDRVYVCEAVHHFGRPDLPQIFHGISRQLKEGGRIVIEKPSEENGILPFVKGKRSIEGLTPVTTEQLTDLLSADFEEVRVTTVNHVLNLEMRRMKDAIRMRYASSLSALSDAEIEAGVAQLEEEHAAAEFIRWPINKDIISARVRK